MNNKKVHMIGIGGISMSAIAKLLIKNNYIVTGSDSVNSDNIKQLIDMGINITIGSDLTLVKKADIIIYTAAIKGDNEELVLAKNINKKIYERSEFLGMLTKEYKNNLCISGTHGKSSTTGMVSSIFLESKIDATIQIGAIMPSIDGNLRIGANDYFIMEACEYNDSFLNFFPTGIIITNIDDDHLNYFKNINNIVASFQKYINKLPTDGILVINSDDINSKKLIYNHIITYGITNDSDYMAKNITYDNLGYPIYDLYKKDRFVTKIKLKVHGKHNIYNSLGSIALTNQYINDFESIKKGIQKYTGIKRRFEFIKHYKGFKIYDDYAHHPTEINTTLESIKCVNHNKNYIIFQSHTYSRTYEHLNDFARVLSKFDNVIIAPIYAAREENTQNVKEENLVDLINKYNGHAIYIDSFDNIVKFIKDNACKNDLVLTLGAGNINDILKEF